MNYPTRILLAFHNNYLMMICMIWPVNMSEDTTNAPLRCSDTFGGQVASHHSSSIGWSSLKLKTNMQSFFVFLLQTNYYTHHLILDRFYTKVIASFVSLWRGIMRSSFRLVWLLQCMDLWGTHRLQEKALLFFLIVGAHHFGYKMVCIL